jgi:hypothetical protein
MKYFRTNEVKVKPKQRWEGIFTIPLIQHTDRDKITYSCWCLDTSQYRYGCNNVGWLLENVSTLHIMAANLFT